MADLTTQLADLNANAKNLLQKYDGAFSKIENLSEQKQKELSDFVSKQVEVIKNNSGNIDIDKIKKEIDDKVASAIKEIEDSGKGWNYKNVNANSDIVANDFVKADTSGGAITLTLPDSPNDNDMIIVWDIKGTFNSNNCTIDGNGNKIMGDDTIDLDIDNKEYHIIYDDNSSEWRVS